MKQQMYAFDTHKAVKELTEAGAKPPLAEAMVSTLGTMVENLPTRQDLQTELAALRKDFDASKKEIDAKLGFFQEGNDVKFDYIKKDIAALREEIDAKLVSLREEFKAGNAALREEIDAKLVSLREEFKAGNAALREEIDAKLVSLREEFKAGNAALREEIDAKLGFFQEGNGVRFDYIKKDIAALREDLDDFKGETKAEFAALREEIDTKLVSLREELKADNVALREELKARLDLFDAKARNREIRMIIVLGLIVFSALGLLIAFLTPFLS